MSSRIFVIFFKNAEVDPQIKINNLTGYGRLDVLCRSITNAFFLSNSIRTNTILYAYFHKSAQLIKFNGKYLKGFNPDERSIAGLLRRIFQNVTVSGVTTQLMALEDFESLFPSGYILVPNGSLATNALNESEKSKIYFLGDHLGFSSKELEIFNFLVPVSLGKKIYLTSQCISLLHFLLDLK